MEKRWIGIMLLVSAALVGLGMLFVDWYLVPIDTHTITVRFVAIKLSDILFQQPTLMQVPLTKGFSALYLQALVYPVGIALCLGLAAWGWRHKRASFWPWVLVCGYLIFLSLNIALEAMWMGLYALSAPYIGVHAAPARWLLILFCGGLLIGTALVVVTAPRQLPSSHPRS